jgi:Uma2 family endonuclease
MAQGIETENGAPVVASSPPAKMTYDEFLTWADGLHAEWVDGEVIVMSPISQRHQLIASFLAALLQFFVEAHESGVVLTAPFQMKLETRPSGREPDLIFVARARVELLKKNYLDGAADVAVEIISPESRARDRGDKFYEYEQGGVREYWLIDPVRKQAEFYVLGDDGIYRLAPVGADDIFRSSVLDGLQLKVGWLWQEPLPKLLDVLKEWGLV